ncbi:MAG: hypothetical protein C0469_13290 [Cyanobacteria bacterium DS2.3.42]|nr:hypothetical protein [Cyanobacteria bacterium DS2.3.42]
MVTIQEFALPDRTPQKKINHSEPAKLFADSESPEPAALPDLEVLPPETVIDGKYKILSCLGSGVVAVVYKVEHVLKNKEYALKLFAPEFSDSQLQRFQSDAKAASLLEHPNTATLADFGLQDGNQPYYVTETVEGVTLADYLNRCGRLTYDDIFSVFLPLCWALQDAHEKGIIHRNVKPSNIMLIGEQGNWQCKLLDFATSKLSEGGRKPRDQSPRVSADPLYMSPEQCSGKKLDYRTDIYSLGCALFEAITARPPFTGATTQATKQMHLSDTPPTLKAGSLGREFPEDLESIVQTMLAKDPQQRYTSASQVAENLMRLKLSAQLRIKVRPKETTNKISQENTIFILCLTTAVALGLAFFFWLQLRQPAQDFDQGTPPHSAVLNTYESDLISDIPAIDDDRRSNARDSASTFFSQISTNNGKEFRKFEFPNFPIGTLKDPKGGLTVARRTYDIEWLGPCQFSTTPNVFEKCPKLLKRFRDDEIRSIEFNQNRDIHQEDLLKLKSYEYLDEVSFNFAHFNDEGLGYLEQLPHLTSLSLLSTGVTTSRLQRFSSLPKLKKLAVRDMGDITSVLRRLQGSNQLKELQLLFCSDLDKSDFEIIASLANLQTLAFSQRLPLEANLFDALTKSKSLKALDLSDSRLSDAAVQSLGKLKNLRTLTFSKGKLEPRHRIQISSLLPDCKMVLH